MNRRFITGLAAGIAAALAVATPAQAAAPKATVVYSSATYITKRFAVHDHDIAVLACSTVNEVRAGGTDGDLPFPGCSARVEDGGGIAYSRDGSTIAHTITVRSTVSGPNPAPVDARLYLKHGEDYLLSTDVGTSEWTTNPDGRARYGSRSTNSCVTRALGADARYQGRLDSTLQSVAAGPARFWYVADRDGNTVYRVDAAGKLSVLAVLAPADVIVSEKLAKKAGWPTCVVGTKVSFEAAPDEVEVGADGTVYVAGRPKLRSGITATSSIIYAISPTTKKVTTLRQRYGGSVDLAAGTKGRLFVAQPDLNRIAVIAKGTSSTYLKLPRVLAVETDNRSRLYAVRDSGANPAKTPGTVVRIS